MSQIQSTALTRLQELFPDHIGDNRRWSLGMVNNLIMLAARDAWERIGLQHGYEEISLVDDQAEYTLDVKFISVTRVEFSSQEPEEGASSVYDFILEGATFGDFDQDTVTRRGVRGVRPVM